jgi:opacity protein-like surface antigen
MRLLAMSVMALTLLPAASASASAQPVTYLGETDEPFVSDSRQLLSDGGPGVIRTFDPLRRKAGRLAIDAGCRLGAVGTRTAAVGCRGDASMP